MENSNVNLLGAILGLIIYLASIAFYFVQVSMIAKMAQEKGRKYARWWFYAFFLFGFSIIHLAHIKTIQKAKLNPAE